MQRSAAAGGAIITTVLVWALLHPLPGAARLWATLLLVPLPVMMILQARALADGPLPRRGAYVSSIFSLWVLAAATALVARSSGYDPPTLGFFTTSPAALLAWTFVLTAAGVAVLFAFRWLGVRETPVTRELLPDGAADRALFSALSLSAGFCEELVFRGFLLHALHAATGSPFLALLLSSGAFGVVHAYQQPLGALRAALLGALLAVPLLLGQPLWAPILAHAAIDLLSGLWLARYLLR